MSKRGTDFIEQWVRDNLAVKTTEDERIPSECAQRCTSAAVAAGISKEEIEEDFGNLEEFMERAIADIADQKALKEQPDV